MPHALIGGQPVRVAGGDFLAARTGRLCPDEGVHFGCWRPCSAQTAPEKPHCCPYPAGAQGRCVQSWPCVARSCQLGAATPTLRPSACALAVAGRGVTSAWHTHGGGARRTAHAPVSSPSALAARTRPVRRHEGVQGSRRLAPAAPKGPTIPDSREPATYRCVLQRRGRAAWLLARSRRAWPLACCRLALLRVPSHRAARPLDVLWRRTERQVAAVPLAKVRMPHLHIGAHGASADGVLRALRLELLVQRYAERLAQRGLQRSARQDSKEANSASPPRCARHKQRSRARHRPPAPSRTSSSRCLYTAVPVAWHHSKISATRYFRNRGQEQFASTAGQILACALATYSAPR